jgi:glycosyltransferase involved in cell wall biosynthesis
MKSITVFTPTFNRAHLLPRLYKSLCDQTSKDFIWLIINDGSIDNSEDIVKKWSKENEIEIQYAYKENGGMHTGHNLAYSLIKTELNICIDSDDYMPENAIEIILTAWNKVVDKDNVSGLVGLDANKNRKVLGTEMPFNIRQGSYYDLYNKYGATGDKKFVLKTKDVKKYQLYPEYKNEKLVPLGILYIMMGECNPFVFLNEILCIVEYQEGGSSSTILQQYKQSPNGFGYARQIGKKYSSSIVNNYKNSIHLVSSAILAKKLALLTTGPKVIMNYLALPFGILLYLYVRLKSK